jgi:hypothetical protein
MITEEPAITVEEVSMQEWAMMAFHAERAPRRVRVTVKTLQPVLDGDADVARTGRWMLLLAAAMAGMAWWVL